MVNGDPEPSQILDSSQLVENYNKKQTLFFGGSEDEIISGADLDLDLQPRYYRQAKGFTVFGESCFDVCAPRDGYAYSKYSTI